MDFLDAVVLTGTAVLLVTGIVVVYDILTERTK